MNYTFPDAETLGKYNALLMAVLIEARFLAYKRAPHEQIAGLIDTVHNVPDLLCRWPDMNEEYVLSDLRSYEQKYCQGHPRFTGILTEGPRENWQVRWTKPAA